MIARALILAWVLSFTVSLRGADSGGYLNFEVGYNIANDLDADVSGAGPTASGVFNLDPGFRISVTQGFILNRLMALELETGFIYNSIDSEGLAEFEARYGHVPAMVNVVFRHDFEFGLTPFVGIGGGGAASIFDLSVTTSDFAANETNVKFLAAGQGIAGLRYRFNDNVALGLVYKYFATSSSEFDIRGVKFDFDPVRNHSIALQFNYSY